MEPSRRSVSLCLIGLCLAIAPMAAAQPAPALGPIAPIALKNGRSIEITLGGKHLSSLSSCGVAGGSGLNVAIAKPSQSDDSHVHLKITAAADAEPGEREARLIGPDGVTRPFRVFVSQYDVANRPIAHGAAIQDVHLPAALVGRVDAPGGIHVFRFNAEKSRRMIFDVHAARIGSALEPVVTIHMDDGRELKTRIEHHQGDPVVIFDPPADGQYLLRLRDLQYRGGDAYDYRIIAGHVPFLESLLPSSGRPGEVIEARPIGYNLEGCDSVRADLSMAAPGPMRLCAKTALGMSNAVPFEVTDLPQAIESEPNDKPQEPNPVALGSEISGHMGHPNDEDFFRFHVPYHQAVSLEVLAGRYGSPVTPLLQLRNVKGDVIESNDGTPDADARIVREVDAGDYLASIRDLAYGGGDGYWYRLKIEPARTVSRDFSVRFTPDAPRLHRGGNVAVWCDVQRRGGFHGDVTIAPESLPAGVTARAVTVKENAGGCFTLSASPDAALGTVPLRLRATGTIGDGPAARDAQPEMDGHVVQQAYLTVVDPAPFGVEAIAAMTPAQLQQASAQIQALATRLDAPNPRFDAALAKWEKQIADRPVWTVLNPATLRADKGTQLVRQPDGSILATGASGAQDQYTLTARTEIGRVTGVRLEVLADPRLPNHGPGRAPNGNFVLTDFKLLASSDGASPRDVPLRDATADFAQRGFPVAFAIDHSPSTGWAIDNQQGRDHVAYFQLAAPLNTGDGATLTFVLDQKSPFAQHNIGRLRISITTADPAAISRETQAPANVLNIASIAPGLRTDQQRAALTAYFRMIDPQTAALRSRLDAMRSFAAPYAEIQRLRAVLTTGSPQMDAAQKQWETAMQGGAGWSVLGIKSARSAGGADLTIEPGGSVFVSGANPPTDTYELAVATPLKGITAIRLEALPDARLPGEGPGRAADGNFILTGVHLIAGKAIAIASATASVQQQGFPIDGALNGKGWAIAPNTGIPADATFQLKTPLENGAGLKIVLEQLSKQPRHTIGHFRLWATTNPQPDAALRPPLNIAKVLGIPAASRSPEQSARLAAYFRAIAPALQPIRQRLADLAAAVPAMPLRFARNRPAAIPVPIVRADGFKGDVRISLEGYAGPRRGRAPASIATEIKLDPLALPGDKQFGMLTFVPSRAAPPGTQMVVLKAQSNFGGETLVTYSRAFPITIEK